MQIRQHVSEVRHKWFPLVALVALAAWWQWSRSRGGYQTIAHFVVTLIAAVAMAIWFRQFGGGRARTRRRIVVTLGLAVVGFFILFRPVYNGDMGVYRWRLRFARSADQGLAQLQSSGVAA